MNAKSTSKPSRDSKGVMSMQTRRPVAEVTHWDAWEGEKKNSAALAHR